MEGWQVKPIGDVFRVVNGGTPKTGVVTYWDGPHAWITPAEMGGLESPFISTSRRTLTEQGLRVGAELVPPGSIILSTRAPIGHLVINEVPMAFNQGCKGLIPASGVESKFAYYFLLANVPLLDSLGTGATFKELSGSKLKEVPFHFPAQHEQRRIVAILDEAFEGIATAKAHAEKNLRNAREVFELQRTVIFSENQGSWPRKLLGEVATVQSGGTPLVSTGEFWGGSIAWYSSGELNDLITREPERFITEAGLASSNAKLFPEGSLLVGMYDTAALKMSLLHRPAAFNQAIAGVMPNASLETEFLLHAINVQKLQLLGLRRGVRQKNLSLGKIKEIMIPLPSPRVQREVVERLRDAGARSAQLEDVYRRKLAALDELKQSLLHQAFSGQL